MLLPLFAVGIHHNTPIPACQLFFRVKKTAEPAGKGAEVVAYDDLGAEAIRRLEVENFPVIVVMDSEGNNLYETAVKEYCSEE